MKKLLLYYIAPGLWTSFIITEVIINTYPDITSGRDISKAVIYDTDDLRHEFPDKTAEINLTEHTILQDFDGPNTIATADFDGDGDIDITVSSFDGNYISWLENDGNENFTEHLIVQGFGQPRLDVARIDDDQDFDIIAASQSGDKIAWFENGGAGNFTVHTIAENWESAGIVYARDQQREINLDINGDGHTDFIVTAPNPGNKISWFENDGNQNFTEHVLKENWYWVRRTSAYDIDNDGDIDIFAAAKDGKVIWFENDGNENFSEHIITSDWGEPNAVLAEDINKDGYIDLAATSVGANEVAWFENDGSRNFIKYTIRSQYNGAYGLAIFDIDNDNDFDIIATAWISGTGSIFENNGDQTFTEYVFCNNGLELLHIFITNLDNDNDQDIIGVCYAPNIPQLRWWENNSVTDVEGYNSLNPEFKLLQNYPNPFNPVTTIEYQIPPSNISSTKNVSLKLSVYNLLGKEEAVLVNKALSPGSYRLLFNVENLSSGVYLYRLKTGASSVVRKMIVLK